MCSISAPVTPSFGVRVIARARAGEQLDFKCGPREQTRGGGRARRLCPSHTPAGLATLTKLYALRLRVRSAVRGFVGDADLDAGLALLIEHPPRPVARTDREGDDARSFRMHLNALHALPPKPKQPGAGDPHPEAGRAAATVQLQLAEAEQVADARCAAGLAQAQDSARLCVGDIDGAAGICSHRRGEWQHAVAPRPPPSLAAGGPGADLKSVRAAGDHIATEGAHEGTLGGELAHPGVAGLGDVDVASGIGAHTQHEAAHLSRGPARGTPLAAGGRGADLESLTTSRNDVVAEGAHEGTLGGELADATVAVGDVEAAANGGDPGGEAQLTGAAAGLPALAARGLGTDLEPFPPAGDDVEAPGPDEGARVRELVHADVGLVGDEAASRPIADHVGGAGKLPGMGSGDAGLATRGLGADLEALATAGDDVVAEGAHEGTLGGELADAVVGWVRDVDISGVVDGDPAGEAELTGPPAGLARPAFGHPGTDFEPLTTAGHDVEAPGLGEFPRRREAAHPLVHVLGGIEPSNAVGRDAERDGELSSPATAPADDGHRLECRHRFSQRQTVSRVAELFSRASAPADDGHPLECRHRFSQRQSDG